MLILLSCLWFTPIPSLEMPPCPPLCPDVIDPNLPCEPCPTTPGFDGSPTGTGWPSYPAGTYPDPGNLHGFAWSASSAGGGGGGGGGGGSSATGGSSWQQQQQQQWQGQQQASWECARPPRPCPPCPPCPPCNVPEFGGAMTWVLIVLVVCFNRFLYVAWDGRK